ncbi:hypothetical protein [Nocardia miyunensis]|uniref:hypothetical protein n=1 Tax=Nocardia miyunensis TaxID=282684 RepID=UPI00082F6651|nr:hypothetical protein [Nocardia miyunensis]
MNQRSFEFCDEVPRQCFGAVAVSPRMRRDEVETLLSDDGERLSHSRRVAIEWGIRDAGPIVDQVRVTPLRPGSTAMVDDRFGHDRLFSWPLDTRLRRMFDDQSVLRVEAIGRP